MFKATWLELPIWTPLSALNTATAILADGIAELGGGWFALTNAGFGGAPSDPGIAALLWASTVGAAMLVTGNDDNNSQLGRTSVDLPLAELSVPKTFGEIVRAAAEVGVRAQHNASYQYSTGRFRCSELVALGKKFYFARLNPEDDDEPIAIMVRLR